MNKLINDPSTVVQEALRGIAAAHDGERRVLRALDAAADRAIEEIRTDCRDALRRRAGRVGGDGRAVDDDRALAERRPEGVDDREEVRVGTHARHDDVAGRGELRGRRQCARTGFGGERLRL